MKPIILHTLILITLLAGLVVAGCHKPTDPDQVSVAIFSPPGGTYQGSVEVVVSTATLGTTILYTTDGSDPNSNSTVYTGPIMVSETTTLKAKAYRTGLQDSAIATAIYTIEPLPIPDNFVFVEGGTVAGITVADFYIDKYELTNAEWRAVMGSGGEDTYPHVDVSWFGAIEYCNRRSMQEGLTRCYSYLGYGTNPDDWPSGWNIDSDNAINVTCDWTAIGYRLPSEAEWEYAARGGLQTHGYTYSGSNDLNEVGWYYGNSYYDNNWSSHPVGQLAPNELGTYDMSGNINEWCWDRHSISYRVRRGGYFYSSADYCAVSIRLSYDAAESNGGLGFRVCRVSP